MTEFTEEEQEGLRELLKYRSEFEEMMALRGARALLFKTYRTVVIGTAGLVTASIFLWDQLKSILRGLIQ